MKNSYLITGLLFLVTLVAASCDDGNNQNDPLTEEQMLIDKNFRIADTNGDHVVDENEIEAELLKDFNNQDVNGDGQITKEDHDHINDPEYQGIPVTPDERAELIHDANMDQVVTLQEYVESVRELIVEPMDADDNGVITIDEALSFNPGFN